MNEVNVAAAKSNVVSFKSYTVVSLQTPFQEVLMELHAPVERFFEKLFSPLDRLLETVDAGTSVFRKFLNKQ